MIYYSKIFTFLCWIYLLAEGVFASAPTPFSCVGKVIGGYYADVENQCQMFHVCTLGGKGEIQDIVFRCLNGTVFDQETRVCEREEEVNCSKAEAFFHLNNELYGPGIIPHSAADFNSISGLTHGQKLRDELTPYTYSHFECKGKTDALIYADVNTDCKLFHLCVPQHLASEVSIAMMCADEDHYFDSGSASCVEKRFVKSCSKRFNEVLMNKAEVFSVQMLKICPYMKKGSFVVDFMSNCQQYIECPTSQMSVVPVRKCPEGTLFSQMYQKCVLAEKISCKKDVTNLLQRVELRIFKDMRKKETIRNEIDLNGLRVQSASTDPFFFRYKRGLALDNKNSETNFENEGFSKSLGIFNEQSSVIEHQPNGNVVVLEGRGSITKAIPNSPQFINKNAKNKAEQDQIQRIFHTNRMSFSLQPDTFLEFNKTDFNGTVIEVSEIASPDNKGKVTITSIVPKILNQNGNGGTTNRHVPPSSPSFVSEQGTKIRLIGSNTPNNFSGKNESLTKDIKNIQNFTLEASYNETNLNDSDSFTTTYVYGDEENSTAISETEPTNVSMTAEGEFTTLSSTDVDAEVTDKKQDISLSPITTQPSTTTSTTTTEPPTTSAKTVGIEPETGSPAEEGSVKTNFTCKDKELEQFYPDIENDCKLFHYCSPGFTEAEVLDLTFVCSGETRFDIKTKKCQEKSTVLCGDEKDTTTSTTSTTTSTTTTSTTTTTTSTTSSTTTSPTTTSTSTTSSTTTTPKSTSTNPTFPTTNESVTTATLTTMQSSNLAESSSQIIDAEINEKETKIAPTLKQPIETKHEDAETEVSSEPLFRKESIETITETMPVSVTAETTSSHENITNIDHETTQGRTEQISIDSSPSVSSENISSTTEKTNTEDLNVTMTQDTSINSTFSEINSMSTNQPAMSTVKLDETTVLSNLYEENLEKNGTFDLNLNNNLLENVTNSLLTDEVPGQTTAEDTTANLESKDEETKQENLISTSPTVEFVESSTHVSSLHSTALP